MNTMIEKTMEERIREFKNFSIINECKMERYDSFTELILDGCLKQRMHLPKRRIVEVFKTNKSDLNNCIYLVKKKAEELVIPTEVLNRHLESFQMMKDDIPLKIEKYKEAFKTLEQELAAK